MSIRLTKEERTSIDDAKEKIGTDIQVDQKNKGDVRISFPKKGVYGRGRYEVWGKSIEEVCDKAIKQYRRRGD